ncbi:MAG: iron-sulfur cluster assembly accessory protein [Cytophagales bacterium]|nr:MAG: iron-sulfur cluster assembly accessory protein [Cytophagales bacterium]
MPAAEAEIKRLFSIKGLAPTVGLRIAVRGAGCSGTTFVIGFDEPQPDDHTFNEHGFNIFIQKKHFLYLTGVSVDFLETNEKSGFVFS